MSHLTCHISTLTVLAVTILCSAPIAAQPRLGEAIDAYLQPYVQTNNFSGSVLVEKDNQTVFEKAYGFADRERRVPNSAAARFHIASVSMQFTAAAVLALVDQGKATLDESVGRLVPGIAGADKITLRDLLTERSGLPDINGLPDYNEVLQQHQTPASLIAKIAGHPLLFDPGSNYLHEEHSAYNLLALIVEKKTGLAFAAAVQNLVFHRLGLPGSGIDDDSPTALKNLAKGYEPDGTYALKPAAAIHWSAKTGNACVYTTARDQAHLVAALFQGPHITPSLRREMLDTATPVGYGWFKGANQRFGEIAYYMNGRAPGFASFVLHLPGTHTTVVVLSNIYSSATTTIGNDVASIALGLPYQPFRVANPALAPSELKEDAGIFRFGPDFYQPNAQLALKSNGSELFLHWPAGSPSALIPLAHDRFVDRSYWEEVKLERDSSARPKTLVYGSFHGDRFPQ